MTTEQFAERCRLASERNAARRAEVAAAVAERGPQRGMDAADAAFIDHAARWAAARLEVVNDPGVPIVRDRFLDIGPDFSREQRVLR